MTNSDLCWLQPWERMVILTVEIGTHWTVKVRGQTALSTWCMGRSTESRETSLLLSRLVDCKYDFWYFLNFSTKRNAIIYNDQRCSLSRYIFFFGHNNPVQRVMFWPCSANSLLACHLNAGLMSTCPQIELNDYSASLGETCQLVEFPSHLLSF